MRFEITPYPDHPDVVDLTALRERLTRAAVTGQRLHIRPRPRLGRPATRDKEHRP